MTSGKNIRLGRIINQETGRIVIIPMDDGLLDGPEGGLRDMKKKVFELVEGEVDAVLGFKGLLNRCHKDLGEIPFIMNITASTFRRDHTKKTLVGSVEDALRCGADAVAVHVNVTSQYETEMLHNLGTVSESCDKWGMPLLALMYPRKEGTNGKDDNYLDIKKEQPEKYAELVRHATRIGVELGADIIKTYYTGTIETFRTVIESAAGVPVVIAGGPKISNLDILRNAYESVQAGGSGVCFGRNGFNREDTSKFVKCLRAIVHDGRNVDEALKYLSTAK